MERAFIGIDAGSLKTLSWIALLEGSHFALSDHAFTSEDLSLPWLSNPATNVIAIDAPQGLPYQASRRCADCAAKTPTRILPATREELRSGRRERDGVKYPFLRVVELGCEVFWANRKHLYGLRHSTGSLVETYPRAILLRWPNVKKIPSKSRNSASYIELVTHLLKTLGYSCARGSGHIRVDHCDAMLCALAAKAHHEGKADYLGLEPSVDSKQRLLREGYIVVPQVSPLCLFR